MTASGLARGAAIIMGIALVMLAGCASDRGTTLNSPEATSDVTNYFPLTNGYQTQYLVQHNSGASETVSFEVGGSVPFVGGSATQFFSTSSVTGQDTSFFQIRGNALYLYADSRSSGEKILELPLNPGESWNRFDQSGSDGGGGNIYTDIITGIYDKPEGDDNSPDTLIDPGQPEKSVLPTVGEMTMSVLGIDQLTLVTGSYHPNAVKISNGGDTGRTNYYWFAPQIGLVKWVIGSSDGGDTGQTVGTLTSYGTP